MRTSRVNCLYRQCDRQWNRRQGLQVNCMSLS
jgi:hypothetical protein